MKKLLILFLLSAFLISCERKNVPKKYTIEMTVNNWTDFSGDDVQIKSAEIMAKSVDQAYAKGYKRYKLSKEVAKTVSGEMSRSIIYGFRVLDVDRENIKAQISKGTLDSIHRSIDYEIAHLYKNEKTN